MQKLAVAAWVLALSGAGAAAKTVVFWQEGFPAVDTAAPARRAMEQALAVGDAAGQEVVFADVEELGRAGTLDGTDLLVLPYGSAFPEPDWAAIHRYLESGGNLLVLGGRPFGVTVAARAGAFEIREAAGAYERRMGIRNSYPLPAVPNGEFTWREGYGQFPALKLKPARCFALEGRLSGLGYLRDGRGDALAAPVVVMDHTQGGRWVMADFTPEEGFWETQDGRALMGAAAAYARQGAAIFSVEMTYSTYRPGETPEAVVHLRRGLKGGAQGAAKVKLEVVSGAGVAAKAEVECEGKATDAPVVFPASLGPGFYRLRATYEDAAGKAREYYGNGFWIEDQAELEAGPWLGAAGDFLTWDGKPFFPVGTNYFSTEENGWDFSGPRNAAVWEDDFAAMERHGVSMVRTGVWSGQFKFLDAATGAVTERFLRNLEAYLRCARKHHIAVNFTFFAFDPQTTLRMRGSASAMRLAGTNPYLDPVTIRAEQNYMLSIVSRFRGAPDMSWDLINEPSFSNPDHLWRGNTPNGDPAESEAWRKWLEARYGETGRLAAAWSESPDQVRGFGAAPLPSAHDLSPDMEGGNTGQQRALDYNLFAQQMFSGWVKQMVEAIRAMGSTQVVDVGQDEGGVQNRVLNQFYAASGLGFTTNHTYRQNDALLWDSLAAKAPGIANIIGETGYQPVILPNGAWQYDELTGMKLLERKWAYSFTAGNSGFMTWDWDREVYFGMLRSDGSQKLWVPMMEAMGEFARRAQGFATRLVQPDVALVLPQSLQLSTLNALAIQAEQSAVRAMYGYARAEAYAVGERQIENLGQPKLILLPSPWILSETAWQGIMERVKAGATLLVTGPFDDDAHFHATGRAAAIGIRGGMARMLERSATMEWPGGRERLTFSGAKTGYLEKLALPGGATLAEVAVGQGRVLAAALPVEWNDNLEATGALYRYALKRAGVAPVYTTELQDADVLISPEQFPEATLYTVVVEGSSPTTVGFRDAASGKELSGLVDAGRAAMVLVTKTGGVAASYGWSGTR